jgi:hypothetical protein
MRISRDLVVKRRLRCAVCSREILIGLLRAR